MHQRSFQHQQQPHQQPQVTRTQQQRIVTPSSPTTPYHSYNPSLDITSTATTTTTINNSYIIPSMTNQNQPSLSANTTPTGDNNNNNDSLVEPDGIMNTNSSNHHGINNNSSSNLLVDVNIHHNTNTNTLSSQLRHSNSSVISKTPSSIAGTSFNLMNSIVGAGIIGIPYALQQSGIIVGIFLLILVGYLTDKSLRILIDCSLFHPILHYKKIYTFEELIRIPYGRIGYQFILFSMFIMAYGAMIAYLIIIKDTIPKVFGFTNDSNNNDNANDNTNNYIVQKELIMTISSLFIILPLSLLRDISMLSCTSAISVLADGALVIIIIIFSPTQSTIENYNHGLYGILSDYWINSQLFIGLGVLSTAMACQHSAFLISGSLSNISSHRWSIVTFRSISIATIMTLLLGIFGFLGYLNNTQGNVLNNFPEQSIAINSGRALLGITMYLTYPMESLVARHVIIQLFYNGNLDNTTIGRNGEIIPEQKVWCCGLLGRREFVTIVLFICTLIPALLVDDLGPVLSITGSLGASCIAYIAPGLVYLGVNGGHFLQWVEGVGSSNESTIDNTDIHHDKDSDHAIELPIVGDANARMTTSSSITSYQTASPTNNSIHNIPNNEKKRRRRPFWWYIVGMPIWIAIAKRGERGTREYMNDFHSTSNNDDDEHHNHNTTTSLPDATIVNHMISNIIVQPKHRDYYISIFMIIFGLIAAICGVLSNIYVEINNIFFTPQ